MIGKTGRLAAAAAVIFSQHAIAENGVTRDAILLGQSVALTGAAALRTPFNRYIFHVRASYYDETEKIVEHVVSTGGRSLAVLYQDDAYGQAGLKGVEIAMAKRHLKISALGTVERVELTSIARDGAFIH